MPVKLPFRDLHGLDDARINFEYLETHWPTSTGGGVPPGGATGQVLTKTSPADYASAWLAPAGGGGGDANFVFTQASAANPWSVTHSLGKYPSVMVVDSGNNVLIPDVHYIDANSLTVSFNAATSGKAYIN